jgi:gluconate 2-dehydrogenase alpha chain
MIGAKAQPSNTLLPLLENRKNFQMQTGAWVRRIVHENGRATGLQYTDAAGEDYFQPAGIVVLASWTLNNVRLLYLSKLGKPYDPAARTGTLGRNLTHQVQGNTRIFLDKPLNLFMGSGSLGFRISDFDGSSGFTEKDGVLRGGTLGSSSYGNRPIASFGDIPQDTVKKKWGPEWKAAALAWRDRTAVLGLAGEHLAYRQNYMDLDPVYSDKFGDPLIRFTLDWTAHEYRQRDFFAQLAVRVAQAMGARTDEIRPASGKYDVSQYQTTHIQGGAIMGTSAEKSVVNTHLQHWDSPNLWVLGASAFPQNASGNPTLTALALTYRAADALINRYLKNPGRLL